MGSLSCDGRVIEFEDRLLAHLQIVIVQRFRAGEALLLSWLDPLEQGDGRSAIWLTPHVSLHFKFAGSRSPAIDRAWLDSLLKAAASGPGLIAVDVRGDLVRALGQYETAVRHPTHS